MTEASAYIGQPAEGKTVEDFVQGEERRRNGQKRGMMDGVMDRQMERVLSLTGQRRNIS